MRLTANEQCITAEKHSLLDKVRRCRNVGPEPALGGLATPAQKLISGSARHLRPPESRFSTLPLNAAYIFGAFDFLTGGSKASASHGLACHDASLRASVRAVHP